MPAADAHPFLRSRVGHFDHHADDVARGAELAVLSGGVELGKDVFKQVALHVLLLAGKLDVIQRAAGFDEDAGLADFEFGVGHVFGERPGLAAQGFDEGEDVFLHLFQRLVGGKLGPVRPTEPVIGENGLEFLAAPFGGAFVVLFLFVEVLEEKRKESCSMTSAGLGRPPDQSLSQRASIFERRVESVSIFRERMNYKL